MGVTYGIRAMVLTLIAYGPSQNKDRTNYRNIIELLFREDLRHVQNFRAWKYLPQIPMPIILNLRCYFKELCFDRLDVFQCSIFFTVEEMNNFLIFVD
jgi:hypothetical protein